MADIIIRPAKETDGEAIAGIYREYVINTAATLEIEPPTGHEMACRICNCAEFYPFLVCEVGDEVIAYAYACRQFEGAAFDWNASVSTYVSKPMSGKGIGRALLDALEEILRAMGIVNLYSLITYHAKSEYFHLARGFEEAGRMREAAFKQGRWRDLVQYEKILALHERSPQAPRPAREVEEAKIGKICQQAKRQIRL